MPTLLDGESALVTIQPSYALKLAIQSGTALVTELTAEGSALTPVPYTVNPTWLGPSTIAKTYLIATVGGITVYDSGVINLNFLSRRVIAQSHTVINSSAISTEEALATVVIPGGSIGPNGMIRCLVFWTCVNTANTKSARIRMGTLGAGLGGTLFNTLTLTSSTAGQTLCMIRNAGTVDSQVAISSAASPFGTTTFGTITTAYDTTHDLEIVFTSEKNVGAEVLSLRGYSVEVSPDFT